jgi:competence protein ComEC
MVEFGDLTCKHEHDLAYPKNLIGTVDLYLTTQHRQEISRLPLQVYAMKPRAVIMNNGAQKGGAVATFEIIHRLPTPADLWQLHFAIGAAENNSPEKFIANLDETSSNYIQGTAKPDGGFRVANSRNSYSQDYAAHK